MMPLPQLEETMTNLAAYLMLAPTKHPRLILGEPYNRFAEANESLKLRATHYYSNALLAYGVPQNAPELQRVAEWFLTSVMKNEDEDVDHAEMIKLECLLRLKPTEMSIQPRLRRLIDQRIPISGFFHIDWGEDQESRSPIADTLSALQVIMLARDRDLTRGQISDDDLKQSIDKVIGIVVEHKDLARLLRFEYLLTGRIDTQHMQQLKYLIDCSQDYGNVWGISRKYIWDRVEPIIMAMHNRQLTISMVEEHKKTFREIITNTCNVIENLSFLRADYPQVVPVLDSCMELWWNQFSGESAPQTLRNFFSDEYHYLVGLCRTMVTVNAFAGEPQGAQLWLPTLREMSSKFHDHNSIENLGIETALRKWIGIELPNEPIPLKLGLSDASVVRIKPTVYNPIDPRKNSLLQDSLIVKYGPSDEIEQERRNYDALPSRLRTSFVSIPNIIYTNEFGQSFVIMQDLHDYQTLYEIYEQLLNTDMELSRLLSSFLMEVHKGANVRPQYANGIHVRDLYIRPILEQADYIFAQVTRLYSRGWIMKQTYQEYENIHKRVSRLIADIIYSQEQLEGFRLAYMHGDLHTRNIMIRSSLSGNHQDSQPDFKLIDLQSLKEEGDVAHDVGQLVIDLRLLQIESEKKYSRKVVDKLDDLQTELERSYVDFAISRDDVQFPIRLELAKARALIRVAKGLAKQSLRYTDLNSQKLALDRVMLSTAYVGWASDHLFKVYSSIEPDGSLS